MKKQSLRFRQIHLDFHTSPHIPKVGSQFDKKRWQKTLKNAAVNSITCFSKCHHGWSYHPTKVGKMHPNLKIDLLRAQFDACKEIDINVPIYISAGVDDVSAYEHPEWRETTAAGSYGGWTPNPLLPGFKSLDFHSPYLDYLCAQIEEAVRLFPNADGVFLDIISQDNQGCSRWGMDYMLANGLDPAKDDDRRANAVAALERYYRRTTEACKSARADMPVFHNSGHIKRGDRGVLNYQTHLELESLPTGGWGYDHFPESAKYAANTGKDFLGMTGKFHTTWGEFGGFKHPNALLYECAAMIAHGSRCSVGDQLHPEGQLDQATYEIIGTAYRDVAAKEPWCTGTTQVADIGILSSEAEHLHDKAHQGGAETGASRVLLEEHLLFTIIDRDMDFSKLRLLILPDDIQIDDALETKIKGYLKGGGKLLLTGESGLRKDSTGFAFDIGAEWKGKSEFSPDYILPAPEFRPSFVSSPFVMYFPSQRIPVTTGQSIGTVFDPYFNRTYRHYCSHQHAPAKPETSSFDSGVIHENIAYLAHPVFSIYRGYGTVALRYYVAPVIRHLLGAPTVETNLPSTARVTLTRQADQKRWILHLLFANTVSRGGPMRLSGGTVATTASIEVIEDLLPLHDTEFSVRLPGPVTKVTLEPQGTPVAFQVKDSVIKFVIPEFSCHQMIALTEG